jgi:hypothetical protein
MKKFFGILAIAGVLVACDNSGNSSTSGDTTNKGTDTGSTVAPVTPSTTTGGDTTGGTLTTPTTGDTTGGGTTTPTTDTTGRSGQ